MVGVVRLLDQIDPVLLADHPENVELWLPSDIPQPRREGQCTSGLPQLEYRLRYAIANHALQDIRRFRQFSQALAAKTQSHISNTQSTVSRARGQFDRVQQKIDQAAATYWVCRAAIMRLAPNEEFGEWKNILQELHKDDIRSPAREGGASKSCYVPSWIWRTSHQGSASSSSQDFCSALRVEWCKARERATRYEEEVQLIVEEMRRTLAFFNWLACRWDSWATASAGCPSVGGRTKAGISAYAHKQASVYRKLIVLFVSEWWECLEAKSLGSPWLQRYPHPPSTKRRRLVSNVQLYHPKPEPLNGDVPDGEESDLDGEEIGRFVSDNRDLLKELAN